MTKRTCLAVAAAASLIASALTAASAAPNPDIAAPSRYVQMNSPGDGISSGAARTGNGRTNRRMKHMRRRHHR